MTVESDAQHCSLEGLIITKGSNMSISVRRVTAK
jgi:hypothetical protein